jgi:hypothetical protein
MISSGYALNRKPLEENLGIDKKTSFAWHEGMFDADLSPRSRAQILLELTGACKLILEIFPE